MTDAEEWRPVVGFEGGYEVSNLGRVRTVPRILTRKNGASYPVKARIKKTWPCKRGGYPSMMLKFNGVKKFIGVHVLVAAAFHGPRPDYYDVCHIDGNVNNCCVGNLRYGTRKSNMADALRHGRVRRGAKHGFSKLRETDVVSIKAMIRAGYEVGRIANDFDISPGAIYAIKKGRTWRHI